MFIDHHYLMLPVLCKLWSHWLAKTKGKIIFVSIQLHVIVVWFCSERKIDRCEYNLTASGWTRICLYFFVTWRLWIWKITYYLLGLLEIQCMRLCKLVDFKRWAVLIFEVKGTRVRLIVLEWKNKRWTIQFIRLVGYRICLL